LIARYCLIKAQYKLSRDHFTDTKVKEAGNKNQVSPCERPAAQHSNGAGFQHLAYRRKWRDSGSVIPVLQVLVLPQHNSFNRCIIESCQVTAQSGRQVNADLW